MSKKGVANIVLLIGIIICGVLMLTVGYKLAESYIEYKTTSSTRYIATELVLAMDTIHSAPEDSQFVYYTETDENGYPVIGSLEIDTDKREICLHPHSEQEIYTVISSNALKSAGLIATVAAIQDTRRAVS